MRWGVWWGEVVGWWRCHDGKHDPRPTTYDDLPISWPSPTSITDSGVAVRPSGASLPVTRSVSGSCALSLPSVAMVCWWGGRVAQPRWLWFGAWESCPTKRPCAEAAGLVETWLGPLALDLSNAPKLSSCRRRRELELELESTHTRHTSNLVNVECGTLNTSRSIVQ